MNKKIYLLLTMLSLAGLSACSTTANRAPVVERSERAAPLARAVEEAAMPRDPNLYQVKKGDTLLRIALEHGQNYRDLVQWNSLSNPNDIKVDQFLRIVPPTLDNGGVQTSSVTPAAGESRPLAPATATPATPTTYAVVPKKILPRGDKRLYSEATLAEMQRSESDMSGKAVAAEPVSLLTTPAVPKVNTYELSWVWPAEGKVVATFDEGKNKGIDIAGKAGQRVLAAGDGKVMYAGSGIRGYGNLVIVKHSTSLLSAYAHNSSILVKEGQSVRKGEPIAEMGNSDADMVKLHFEIRQQGKPVDPSKFLPSR